MRRRRSSRKSKQVSLLVCIAPLQYLFNRSMVCNTSTTHYPCTGTTTGLGTKGNTGADPPLPRIPQNLSPRPAVRTNFKGKHYTRRTPPPLRNPERLFLRCCLRRLRSRRCSLRSNSPTSLKRVNLKVSVEGFRCGFGFWGRTYQHRAFGVASGPDP